MDCFGLYTVFADRNITDTTGHYFFFFFFFFLVREGLWPVKITLLILS